MTRLIVILSLVLTLSFQASATAKKKKGGNKAKPKSVIDADSLKPGSFRGKVVNPPGTDGLFTVDLEYQYLEPKKGGGKGKGKDKSKAAAQVLVREQQQIQKEMSSAQAAMLDGRDASTHFLRIQQLQALMQRQIINARAQGVNLGEFFTVKTGSQRVEFHASPEVKVRLNEPPQLFTDKGDIKKFTPAELNELKGKNSNLPGFEGHLADVKAGQIVQVTQILASHQEKKSETDSTRDQKSFKTVVNLILVLGEAPAPMAPESEKSKKPK